MDSLISVIIPVYNVSKYLQRCLDSVLSQDYGNLQIILTDDGSTDESGILCDAIAEKDPRVTVIHKENGGLSDARNAGLAAATGEYVTFIDSDDRVDESYISYLFGLIKDRNADISVCEFSYEDEDGKVTSHKASKAEVMDFTSEEAVINQFYRRDISNFAWGKMFKRELWEGITFPKGLLYEDLATLYKVFDRAEKISKGSGSHYLYLQRKDSIMHSEFSVRKMDRITVSKDIVSWAEGKSARLLKAAQCRLFVSAVQVLRELPLEDEKYEKETSTVADVIGRYKKSVFHDKEAGLMTRFIAATFAVFPSSFVKRLGVLYKKVYPN